MTTDITTKLKTAFAAPASKEVTFECQIHGVQTYNEGGVVHLVKEGGSPNEGGVVHLVKEGGSSREGGWFIS